MDPIVMTSNALERNQRHDGGRKTKVSNAIAMAFAAIAKDDVSAFANVVRKSKMNVAEARDEQKNTFLHACAEADALACAKRVVSLAVYANRDVANVEYFDRVNVHGESALDVATRTRAKTCEVWLTRVASGRRGGASDEGRRGGANELESSEREPWRKLSEGAEVLMRSLVVALGTNDGDDDGDEGARARATLRAVSALVADREALRKDLLRAKEALVACREKASRARIEERDAVFEALRLAEARAREMKRELETSKRSETERGDDDGSARAMKAAYDAGYDEGWNAALRLSPNERASARGRGESNARGESKSAARFDGADAVAAEFVNVALTDDVRAREERGMDSDVNAKASIPTGGGAKTLAPTVVRESCVEVKRRVNELESASRTDQT